MTYEYLIVQLWENMYMSTNTFIQYLPKSLTNIHEERSET